MRKRVGVVLVLAGAALMSFAGARYVIGSVRADRARQAWDEESARRGMQSSRSMFASNTSYSAEIGQPVTRLLIPRLDLDEIVVEGVGLDELNTGPGHLPGTVMPGVAGNSVISAHRDRHFRHFDKLVVGDRIATDASGHATTWVVVAIRVVDKDAPALFRTSEPTLTLTTCWPLRFLGTSPQRLIVTAKPISADNRKFGLARGD
jgi:sortase A